MEAGIDVSQKEMVTPAFALACMEVAETVVPDVRVRAWAPTETGRPDVGGVALMYILDRIKRGELPPQARMGAEGVRLRADLRRRLLGGEVVIALGTRAESHEVGTSRIQRVLDLAVTMPIIPDAPPPLPE